MVSSQLCPGSFHNQSYTGSETRDFGSRVVVDGTILNSLCLLTHIGQSIQPSLFNGTSARNAELRNGILMNGTEIRAKLVHLRTIFQGFQPLAQAYFSAIRILIIDISNAIPLSQRQILYSFSLD